MSIRLQSETLGTPRFTEAELCGWLGAVTPGNYLCYHRGFLAVDCDPIASSLNGKDRAELRRVAQRAVFAAENGLVHLTQRRIGPGDFTYLVVARRRPKGERGSLRTILTASATASSRASTDKKNRGPAQLRDRQNQQATLR